MIIRDARKEELSLIREQRVKAYEDHIEKVPAEHWEALKKAISSDADQQENVDLIVAEVNDVILGSVALFPAKTDAYEGYVDEMDYPEIRVLAVDRNARGQGVASALIEECISRAKAKGYDAIGLHTGSFMDEAIALYQGKYGFERMPEYDFVPADDGIVVKAFKKKI
ncbi:acetyltransferase [Jeotgalibacillus malaysiensis]|uniref:Acetyltransferase n=1 Tax=Jeotgalibacillus malaysiensis TaxID=1508404 RepID=A0A0B5AMP4_9BACL|nr:GNAT family N-acetyltransferase [Jeotgalibacillus malaysiensis]AJD89803.1 acetyltransferase [Jeotgalibacillus malaysiensis]